MLLTILLASGAKDMIKKANRLFKIVCYDLDMTKPKLATILDTIRTLTFTIFNNNKRYITQINLRKCDDGLRIHFFSDNTKLEVEKNFK
jgi:hypothetical protein